jgi:hypothetical protein
LFETDSGVRLRYLTDADTRPRALEFAQHPAFFLVWRPVALTLEAMLSPFAADSSAAVLAVQLLVCSFAAAAAALIYLLARRWGATAILAVQLSVLFILSTGSVLLVVPEHWAMASAMMLACFYLVSSPGAMTARRIVALAVLALLIAGTTVTNAVFGVLLMGAVLRKSPWRRAERAFFTLLIAGALVTLVFVAPRLLEMPAVSGFFNLRILEAPTQALLYIVFALLAPVIGPVPYRTFEREHVVLSYEPVSFGQYSAIQWIGVVAWAALLAFCIWRAVSDARSRRWTLWLLAWITFNLVFHNLWGDEFFLYSPHWAWAMFGVVAIALKRLPWPAMAAAATLIVVPQLHTLGIIGQMLRGP